MGNTRMRSLIVGVLAPAYALFAGAAQAAHEHPSAGVDAAGKDQPGAASDAAPSAPSGPTDARDLWTRSTLTGDWGGTRSDLAAKGFTLNLSLTQVLMGVVSGGRDTGLEYLGRGEMNLTLDTTKMGLWPGGIFSVTGEGHFGEPVSTPYAGSLVPVDVNEFFPEADDSFVFPGFTYTQFLAPNFAVFGGKIPTITATSGDMNEFAHGKGDHQFLNTNFSLNPVIALTVPYSCWGAGALVLPTEDLALSAVAIDAHGQADSAQFDSMFSNGVTFIVEGRLTTHFWERTGHQLLGVTYATSSYTDLDQSVANLIIPGLPTSRADSSWSLYYNCDQYFYQPDPRIDRGIGIFARAGLSDGDPNPIQWVASGGVGGKGMISGRPDDAFGIGYFHSGIADTQTTSSLGFGDTQGVEAFYEFALTPWLHVTPDVQWVQPSQDRVDDSWVVGVRVFTSF